ncbi:MAG TPA: universal stress protein [Planctomycetota bacterium]|nr:universal stress protein [Planctomycetota bacterium]
MATLERARARKPSRRRTRGFARILVPLDFTKRDRATVRTALLVAEASGGATTLLHVVYVPDEAALRDLDDLYRELVDKARVRLRRYAAPFRGKRLAVTIEVRLGKPLEEILGRARAEGADLIVLASHAVEPARPAPGWNTLSYGVAALCGCPVLLAK